jgi:hypothetical protein
MGSKNKKVRKKFTPQPEKKPRIDPTIKNPMDENPVWHVSILDKNGHWGWTSVNKNFFFIMVTVE